MQSIEFAPDSWPPQVYAAWQVHAAAAQRGQLLDPHACAAAQRTATLLRAWGVAPLPAVAALLAPLIQQDAAAGLREQHGSAAVALAERLVAWQNAPLPGPGDPSTLPTAQHLVQRRQLFRRAYLDHPDFAFVLLLMADHDTRCHRPGPGQRALAAQTLHVFIPLATMLGMRQVRQEWYKQSTAVLDPQAYAVVTASTWPWNRADKRHDCAALEQRLRVQAGLEDMTGAFRIDTLEPNPRKTVELYNQQVAQADIARWLGVRIVCESVSDCYRLLGIIHSLGRPAALRFSRHFADYIAAPKPNGYQALQTAIRYKDDAQAGPSRGAFSHESLVEFRIMTDSMYQLNEWGVVAATYRAPATYRNTPAWWNGLDRLTGQIAKRAQTRPAAATIQALLADYPLGTTSDPLYLFTPLGEIVLLADGSHPVDFAYRIHSNLSRRATRIEVNGQNVPFQYPLHNGDLVVVQTSDLDLVPAAGRPVGPDLAWMGMAGAADTRKQIRRGLIRSAAEQHPGRSQIVAMLLKMLEYYATQRHYPLMITTQRLDMFLRGSAEARRLADLNALYSEVVAGRLAPQRLLRQLIAGELAAALVTAGGDPMPYSVHRIQFCERCRPVPGDRLLAVQRRIGQGLGLVLHREANERCAEAARLGRRVAVRWAEPSVAAGRELALLDIDAEDRTQLLDDILAVIYREPAVHLYQVHAQAYSNGTADITLALEADSLVQLAALQTQLAAVAHVQRVNFLPPSSAQRLTFKSPAEKRQPNPYTTQEVYDRWMFHDREQPLAAINTWLAEPGPTHPLILHGHRRVGKSSLAHYLEREVVPQRGQFVPVFVDLHSFSELAVPQFVRSLIDRLSHTLTGLLGFSAPLHRPGEDPILWLERTLDALVAQLHGQRLLLILDEFNALMELEQAGRLDPVLFRNLRAVMHAHRDVRWMLIVQEIQFQDPLLWGSASALFQELREISLPHLDNSWARKLILGPTTRCGYHYADPQLPEQIVQLTQGSPYLIQLLCFHLIERAREYGRTNITQEDLDQAVKEISRQGGRYLAHFVEHLNKPLWRTVLATVAAAGASGAWIDVAAQVRPRLRAVPSRELEAALAGLQQRGMVERRLTGGCAQVAIPLGIFHAWIQRTLNGAQHQSRPPAID
ncbi:MAG: TGS domain-containing protein [Chloroflexota bacterium]|nr:TGS domain-containing protein [Chloroflexota bacterium]